MQVSAYFLETPWTDSEFGDLIRLRELRSQHPMVAKHSLIQRHSSIGLSYILGNELSPQSSVISALIPRQVKILIEHCYQMFHP